MNPEQITAGHRARAACVYIRQSSERQVRDHQESQRRQRDLVERAVELGWSRDQIVQIDEDLGVSGSRSQERCGFDHVVADAALGKIGIILALEVARLCRGNHAWYHLLDICGITRTLIADADGIYDPRSHNDRLLLGLKGTMSESELHIMKQRMIEAIRNKAKRGEFRLRLPPGLCWDAAGRIVKTPDEQVQSTIARLFERFGRLGTIHQVHRSLAADAIKVPVFRRWSGPATWILPSYEYVRRALRNPMYAGAYVFGRYQTEEILDESRRPVKRGREVSRPQWHALIEDHHEGYITWEVFEKNQRQIAANRNGEHSTGAPREGRSLLQGLVFCGRCGRRMQIRHAKRNNHIRYSCSVSRKQTGGPLCQDFGGGRLEQRVQELVLDALQPLGVEAMLEAARAHAEAAEAERVRWHQRVDRARYEADLARRQYDEVDPANRLVARELERRFESALVNLEATGSEAKRQIAAIEQPLEPCDEERLRRYTRDLGRLWHDPATRPQDKKRVLRLLVENVTVTRRTSESKSILEATVHWAGGEVTPIELECGRPGNHRYVAPPDLIDLIRTLAAELSDVQIARVLSRRGIRTPKGLPFTWQRVAVTRNNHGIEKGPRVPRKGPDIYSADQAAERLGVCHSTVIRWLEDGLLRGAQLADGAPWRVQLTDDDVRRLTATEAPEGWLTLKAAARATGVSQRAVLQRLKRGEVEGIRVRVGRRSSWRIRVPPEGCVDQPTLF